VWQTQHGQHTKGVNTHEAYGAVNIRVDVKGANDCVQSRGSCAPACVHGGLNSALEMMGSSIDNSLFVASCMPAVGYGKRIKETREVVKQPCWVLILFVWHVCTL
jgi:hypothetical protein